jgi:hypothetical protein
MNAGSQTWVLFENSILFSAEPSLGYSTMDTLFIVKKVNTNLKLVSRWRYSDPNYRGMRDSRELVGFAEYFELPSPQVYCLLFHV